MRRLTPFRLAPLLATVALFASVPAFAEPPRFHGAAGAARAFGPHQDQEFSLGGGALGGVELPLVSELGLHLQLAGLALAKGNPPTDASLAQLETGTALWASAGPRITPFARLDSGGTVSLAGVWFAAGFGITQTGSYTRGVVDGYAGFDFRASRALKVGPFIGLLHVFQPDAQLRPADANVGLAGVHFAFDTKAPEKLAEDLDRDRDGILNVKDRCPDVAEDKDGFEDKDGCPDPDNDKDGIVDAADRCPDVPEDRDGFEDKDGCPEADNDKDGILDKRDKCPMVAEDKDLFEDEDGCPEPDNDKDGIPDKEDLCPNEVETKNGYADHDGCPDEEEVRVVGDRIVLDDRVYFRANSNEIRNTSHPLMDRLAKLVKEHPEYERVHIVGHADQRGTAWYNKKLSGERAKAVLEYLVERGVARERLSSEGMGSERPLVDKKSERAWFLNRRVEFIVTRKLKEAVQRPSVETPAPEGTPPPDATPPPDEKDPEMEREDRKEREDKDSRGEATDSGRVAESGKTSKRRSVR